MLQLARGNHGSNDDNHQISANALVLERLNHVARCIVNANHRIVCAAVELRLVRGRSGREFVSTTHSKVFSRSDWSDSLLFGTWRGRDFAAVALRRSLSVRNILAGL
jgi:hypothetical protein